jgi:hypothetical protein
MEENMFGRLPQKDTLLTTSRETSRKTAESSQYVNKGN